MSVECERVLHKRMQRTGLQWTVRAHMARRVGLKGQNAPHWEIGGSPQSLREADDRPRKGNIDQTHTGGYGGDCEMHVCDYFELALLD